jgi:lipoprotein-anchoring transpeptidase ErfK/SrfK
MRIVLFTARASDSLPLDTTASTPRTDLMDVKRIFLLIWCSVILALCCGGNLAQAKKSARREPEPAKASPQQVEQFTRLQIFLDNANFSPGKIDAHDGDFTRKALALYRQSQGLAASQPASAPDPKAPPDTTGLDLQSVQPVFISYVITKEDAATVGPLPSGLEAQSKMKALPYASLAEAIAEKFHCDLGFFKQLNKGKTDHLKVGDTVTAPNVKPFEISAVKSLQTGSESAAIVANEWEDSDSGSADADSTKEKPEAKSPPSAETKASAPSGIAVHVSTSDNVLKVLAGDKVVAAFPVTIGSAQTESPLGNWKIRAIAKFPNFRYDKKMLNHGERSADFKLLPPGPNNPVGIMWIALNKKGIGIHGTDDPDSIGRASSHGCIRLANWDVAKLAELVKPGVPVTIE